MTINWFDQHPLTVEIVVSALIVLGVWTADVAITRVRRRLAV